MSTIKCNALSKLDASASVPVDTVVNGTAKAWVNFNGTGTVVIRKAFNVSSITDNGTGNYTVNMSSAMPDALYGANVTVGGTSAIYLARTTEDGNARTANAFSLTTAHVNATATDAAVISATVFR